MAEIEFNIKVTDKVHRNSFNSAPYTWNERLFKSKNRVQSFGEVFTPNWMVQKMLNEPEIEKKLNDIHATFLEPAAGEGAFLKEIAYRKLKHVNEMANGNYNQTWKNNLMWAMMSIYGIELSYDNLTIARQAMFRVFQKNYEDMVGKKLTNRMNLYKSAWFVIQHNVVQGDTLSHINSYGQPIIFSEWRPIKGASKLVQRNLFTFDSLFTHKSSNLPISKQIQGSLFSELSYAPKKEKYTVIDVDKVYKEIYE